MAVRPILLHPDPRLKKVAQPVRDFDGDLRALLDDMIETMYDAPGIGLAAPQIGVLLRAIVMDCAKGEEDPRPYMILNPQITWESEVLATYEEGCLSIPEEFADVDRPAEVELRWTDETGAKRDAHFTGLEATCIQHEIDHLDGKLFIDYLGPVKRQMITSRMKKRKIVRARKSTTEEA